MILYPKLVSQMGELTYHTESNDERSLYGDFDAIFVYPIQEKTNKGKDVKKQRNLDAAPLREV